MVTISLVLFNFKGGDDYKMKMNSLISWVGGKKSIRDLIYARFHKTMEDISKCLVEEGGTVWEKARQV